MKIAVLYAESRFTPWKENVDITTVINLIKALPKHAQGSIVHMTEPNHALANLLRTYDFVINVCYGFHELSQADIAEWLDANKIKHLSSGGIQQQMAQDKLYVEQVLTDHNISVPKSIQNCAEITPGLYICKPRKGGCHRGIEITDAQTAFEHFEANSAEDKLTQPYLVGREFSVAIIPNENGNGFETLPPLEVIPYPKRTIYLAGQSHGKTRRSYHPTLTDKQKHNIINACLSAHKSLGLTFFSRVDVRLLGETAYVLDVNTMPNLHPTKSMLPGLLKTHKVSMREFLCRVVRMGEQIYKSEHLTNKEPNFVQR
jgi:D-alanine-D-alanine ligase-like ATP-grasp enzyme